MTRLTRLIAAAGLGGTLLLSACSGGQEVPSADGQPVTSETPNVAPLPGDSSAPASTSTTASDTSSGADETSTFQPGPGVQDAIATFGSREIVQTAIDTAGRVMQTALADCGRYEAQPALDPEHMLADLGALTTPEHYEQIKGRPGALLLVALPDSLSDGSTPAADALADCEGHARRNTFAVSVDHTTDPQTPRLVLEGPVTYDLTLGGKPYVIKTTPGNDGQGHEVNGTALNLIPGPDGQWLVTATSRGGIDLSAGR